jgi:hypothetical protein
MFKAIFDGKRGILFIEGNSKILNWLSFKRKENNYKN